ncbi:MAG: hypothetical protein KKF50_01595 [Nanoarchaeota archaeon]|nr:hypothetical protein [Nanoarchaeota archaeon]
MKSLDSTPREHSRRINDFIDIGIYRKNACYSSSSWLFGIILFCVVSEILIISEENFNLKL